MRQKKLAIREDIRFYADEQETRELFRIKARTVFDIGGSRYDVNVGEERVGVLDHMFKRSLLRSTWTVRDGNEDELMIARERASSAQSRAVPSTSSRTSAA